MKLKEGKDITVAAKNIRAELREAFPGVKFSVQCSRFAGGNAINISWTDGPTDESVQAITRKYAQGTFDGMTDSYDYNKGEARVFNERHGGARWVHTSREHSAELVTAAIEAIAEHYHPCADPPPTPADWRNGETMTISPTLNGAQADSWQALIHRQLAAMAA